METTGQYVLPERPPRYPGGAHAIGEGIHAWLTPNGGWGESNTALIAGHGASLLVDTLWDLSRTSAMLSAFRPHLENAPIAQVVNTHADGDHWFGNQLTGAGQIIATRKAERHMRRHGPAQLRSLRRACRVLRALSYLPIPKRTTWRVASEYLLGMMQPFNFSKIHPMLPNSTFSGKMQLEVGGRRVLLVEVGPAHTLGDLVVYLPEDRIVVAGDILFLGTTPVLWDGSARNWTRACERILEWKVDTVVPGHGPLTDLSGVDAVRKYWQFLRSAAQKHYEKGRPPYLAALSIVTSAEFLKQPFAAWDAQERIVINVYAIYRRLMKRPHSIGTFERLMLLRKAALMAKELRQRAGAGSSLADS